MTLEAGVRERNTQGYIQPLNHKSDILPLEYRATRYPTLNHTIKSQNGE